MKKVALIGFNSTFKTLYLPAIQNVSEPVKWYVYDENPQALAEMMTNLNRAIPCHTIEDLLKFELDGAIVFKIPSGWRELKRAFVNQGTSIYSHPPIEQDLIRLNEELQTINKHNGFMMPGYVNRFSDIVNFMRKIPGKNHLTLTQLFIDSRRYVDQVVWSDLAQLLHTTIYLMGEYPTHGSFRMRKTDRYLDGIIVALKNDKMSAVISINEQAGTQYHSMQMESTSGTFTLDNWQQLFIRQGGDLVVETKDPWETMTHRYGIEQALKAYIERLGKPVSPINPAEMMLIYQICGRITSAISTEGFLNFDYSL
ncbi:MAG: hypothetical protein ACTIJA_05225 [Bavariicoccus seileri]|uniref:hypothetical protein n=1 Tax=Bavariicoccus seileri TaxID=549685 RepID=UPI003F9C842E